jgi:hypothetical protein
MTRAARHRINNEVVQTICEDHAELPDVDKLNAAVPQDQWHIFQGTPQPPWKTEYVVYLLDTSDASLFTFLNYTVGAKIAWENLHNRIKWMGALRGASVLPVVELTSATMKLKKVEGAKKLRPEFKVYEDRWISLGGGQGGTPLIGKPAPAQIGKPVAPVTAEEELNDEIPY